MWLWFRIWTKILVARVAGVEGEGKGKDERTKRASVREGDACKDAIREF